MKRGLTTAEAAKVVGVGRITLQRWIRTNKIRPPKPVLRDGRGVRLWSGSDIQRLRKTKERIYRRGRGRKKRKA